METMSQYGVAKFIHCEINEVEMQYYIRREMNKICTE